MKAAIHLIDVTDFRLPDGTRSADWFRGAFEALGLLGSIDLVVYDGTAGEFPSIKGTSGDGNGIIVTGSAGPVYEDKSWIPPLLEFLAEAHRARRWILGVCFGHHALAVALGGEVRENPRGREMGTVRIHLTPEGRESPLFDGFESGGTVNLVHRTHITRMPEGAVRLAYNPMTKIQSFSIGRSFGYQPHPEMTPPILEQLSRMYAPVLIRKEHFVDDADHLEDFIASVEETPASMRILKNFADMISCEYS
jgi:GMP synthase-like glutamine amidotransferase